jgi:hypothetical protein
LVWADRLAVTGEFNGRHRETFPMVQSSVDPDWHTSIALDSDRRYHFLYLCDGDRWNTDGSADNFVEDGDGRVYSIVDTCMDGRLPIHRDLAVARLSDPARSMSGVLNAKEAARAQDTIPASVPVAVDLARLAHMAAGGRVDIPL